MTPEQPAPPYTYKKEKKDKVKQKKKKKEKKSEASKGRLCGNVTNAGTKLGPDEVKGDN